MNAKTQAPVIHDLGSKLSALERRSSYLSDKIENRSGSEQSLSFDRAELSALQAAMKALKYHRLVVMDLDTPIGVLRAFVAAWNAGAERRAMSEAAKRAELVLEELGKEG